MTRRTRPWAGVAVIVVGHGPRAQVLFVRRTVRRGDPWSGDMAFPGGLADARDADALDTARREAREEVGVTLPLPSRKLPSLWIVHPGLRRAARIVPWVFRLDAPPSLVLAPAEIAEAHWVPMAHLLNDRRRQWIRIRGWLPWWAAVRRWKGQRIWGLTGRMVDDLLRATGSA